MTNIKNITDADFENAVLKSDTPVLVDFWAPWCGPCKAIAPVLEELAQEKHNQLQIVKLNIDENPDMAKELSVRGIPALMLFRNGKIMGQIKGARPKAELSQWIDDTLAKPEDAGIDKDELKTIAEEDEKQEDERLNKKVKKMAPYAKAVGLGTALSQVAGGLMVAFSSAALFPILAGGIMAAYNSYRSYQWSQLSTSDPNLNTDVLEMHDIVKRPAINTAIDVATFSAGIMLFGIAGSMAGTVATLGIGALAVYTTLTTIPSLLMNGVLLIKDPKNAFKVTSTQRKSDIIKESIGLNKFIEKEAKNTESTQPKPPQNG